MPQRPPPLDPSKRRWRVFGEIIRAKDAKIAALESQLAASLAANEALVKMRENAVAGMISVMEKMLKHDGDVPPLQL